MRRRRVVAIALAALVLAWLASGLAVDWLLTRRAGPFDEPVPADLAATCVATRLATHDGLAIGAWWIPAPDARRAALVLHGNDGSRSASARIARELVARGTSVLAITLRAHGDSDGDANDLGFGARADVVAGVLEIERRAPGTPIVVVGTSLGSAAALYAAEATRERVAGWFLETPYLDLEHAVRARLRIFLWPPFDAIAWTTMRASAPLVLGPSVDELAPIRHADRLAGKPVFVLSGDRDRMAPLDETRAIVERIGAGTELVVFPGLDHVALAHADPERWLDAFARFVDAVERARAVAR